ncbi:TetR/AcrR family transcriptional regulator [Nocardioides plantarum]|uniref:TetR/AcrR family transcriptional regulator n=1 Tax=Nocardioides plantarum TaxID=29299 RepID=A0ABV5K5C1_9ACTN|nr:TetR-like C-terminal domain-containing protein [Nocardioides plantarum]
MTARPAERRGRLDRETVLASAESIVDRDGFDALSMTLLAAELDTRVSSLYNHVTNLEDLRSEIQVRAMSLLGRQVQRAAMGHAGADGLRVLSHELRAFARAFPQRYAALTRAPIDRDGFFAAAGDVIEAMGVMVRSTGLPERQTIPTGMAIFSALHGFVALEASGYFDGVPELEDVFEQVVRGAVTAAVLEVTTPRG